MAFFKAPTPHGPTKEKCDEVIDLSSTESIGDASMDDETADRIYEETLRNEIQHWLSNHGTHLFALETTKFLAREQRRENLATKRR